MQKIANPQGAHRAPCTPTALVAPVLSGCSKSLKKGLKARVRFKGDKNGVALIPLFAYRLRLFYGKFTPTVTNAEFYYNSRAF